MPTDTTTGASRRPLTFFSLGRPAALCIDAMSQRRVRPVTSTSTAVIPGERGVAAVTGAGRGIGRLGGATDSRVFSPGPGRSPRRRGMSAYKRALRERCRSYRRQCTGYPTTYLKGTTT
jgi:hypothetical protein